MQKYPKFRELFRLNDDARDISQQLGNEMKKNIFVLLVNDTDFEIAHQSRGKFAVDGTADPDLNSKQQSIVNFLSNKPLIICARTQLDLRKFKDTHDDDYYVLENPRVVDMRALGEQTGSQPFSVFIVNKSSLDSASPGAQHACDMLRSLPTEGPPVRIEEGAVDWDQLLASDPHVIETFCFDFSNIRNEKFGERQLRLMKRACRYSLQCRKPWRRGASHNLQKGIAVGVQSRVCHMGQLGYAQAIYCSLGHKMKFLPQFRSYCNFINQADPDSIAEVQVGDDLATDFVVDITSQVLPTLVKGMFDKARRAGLPPRGRRNFSITAGIVHNFMAPLHEEMINDPLWTTAGCLDRDPSFAPSDFGFAHPGLDGGRGVIMRGSKRYAWGWKGALNVHAGIVSKKTVEAIEEGEGLEGGYLAVALYQKVQPLNFGHRFLRGPPTDFRVWTRNLNMQNSRHALPWVAFRD